MVILEVVIYPCFLLRFDERDGLTHVNVSGPANN